LYLLYSQRGLLTRGKVIALIALLWDDVIGQGGLGDTRVHFRDRLVPIFDLGCDFALLGIGGAPP
jgi:hypothetical protein